MMQRRAVGWAAGVSVVLAVILLGRFNGSPSLPRGLYLELPRAWLARTPTPGELVLACAPPAAGELARRRGYLRDGPCAAGAAGGAAVLGKLVLAAAGDEVAFGAGGLEVNGRVVAGSQALAWDRLGRALPHYRFGRFRMAPGQVWLFAPYHPRSYDSRYFGPVAVSAIRGWLLPVLVANDDRFSEFRLHRFHLSVLAAGAGR
jgi:conjugative transfer signal peptidase TraF